MEEEDKPQGRRKGSKANRKYSDQSIQVDQDPTDVKEFEAFEYLSDRKASINKYVLKSEGTISNYKLYEIVTTKGGHTGKTNRRFKDFEWLYNHLVLQYYGRVIPSLPEKNLKTTFNLEGEGYQNERMRLLERNLNLLLKKKHFCRSVVLHNFLTLSCTDFRMFQSGRKSLIEGEEYMKISLYEEVRETLKSKVLNKAFYDVSKHDKLLNDYLVKLQSFETAAKELHARAKEIYECEEKSAECAAEIFSSCKDFIPTEYSTEEADIGSRYISKLEEQADGVVAFSSIHSNLADVLLNLGDLLRAYHRRHMLLDKFDRKLKEYISASGEKKELRKLEKERILEKVLEIGNHLKEDTEEEYKNIVQQFHSCLEEYAKGISHLVSRQSNTTESMVKASC